jgi:hypothetical protein
LAYKKASIWSLFIGIVADENCDSIRFAYIGFLFNEEARHDSFKAMTDFYANPSTCVGTDTGGIRRLIDMLISEIYSKPIYHSILLEAFLYMAPLLHRCQPLSYSFTQTF